MAGTSNGPTHLAFWHERSVISYFHFVTNLCQQYPVIFLLNSNKIYLSHKTVAFRENKNADVKVFRFTSEIIYLNIISEYYTGIIYLNIIFEILYLNIIFEILYLKIISEILYLNSISEIKKWQCFLIILQFQTSFFLFCLTVSFKDKNQPTKKYFDLQQNFSNTNSDRNTQRTRMSITYHLKERQNTWVPSPLGICHSI